MVKIESLSGEVEVKSKWGEGSTWTIRLPLTLAIIQALMVVVGGEKYAISLGSIQTIEDICQRMISKLVEKQGSDQLKRNGNSPDPSDGSTGCGKYQIYRG